MIDLGLNGSNTSGSALGINDSGVLVGWESASSSFAYTWSTTAGSGGSTLYAVASLNG